MDELALSSLSGKTAIVTGGAKGIGRSIVRTLALRGDGQVEYFVPPQNTPLLL